MSGKGPRLLGIAGWKNSGKTTLAVGLISQFRRRGLVVSTIKRTHHALVSIDLQSPTTDTARHKAAGAIQTALVGLDWVMLDGGRAQRGPLDLEALTAVMQPVDLILVEGYKSASIPKIEVVGPEAGQVSRLGLHDPDVIAVAAEDPDPATLPPRFARSDIAALADFAMDFLAIPRP